MTTFDELHDELRAVARSLLSANPPGSKVGWGRMAELGWSGVEVPETLGGAGATFAEVAVLAEELARTLVASPYLGSVVLGVAALGALEVGPDVDALLRSIASGTATVAVALCDGARDSAAATPAFRIERSGASIRLHGRAEFVADAAGADHLLLVATGADGPEVAIVDPSTTGLRVTPQPTLDTTRHFAVVDADAVPVDAAAVHRFIGDPSVAVARLGDRAAIALACDSLGVARAMLEATVAYAGRRHQFGRPIGSFQAVKHACADMAVQIAMATELVGRAVRHLVDGAPDTSLAASMAKAHATAMGVQVAGAAMQLHGGIGYAWESGVHAYLKRATLNRSLMGSPGAHRRRIAGRHRDPDPPTIGAL